MSRCGKRYVTMQSAVLAAELRTSKGAKPLAVVSCALGDHWHLVPPQSVTGKGSWVKSDPFPPVVVAQLAKRDPWCQQCGRSYVQLENHHRRAKHMGGSKGRAHTQCACNGLRLCRACHVATHLGPALSRLAGRIVRQGVAIPARIAVNRCIGTDDDGLPSVFDEQYPTCDGQWVHSPLETEQ